MDSTTPIHTDTLIISKPNHPLVPYVEREMEPYFSVKRCTYTDPGVPAQHVVVIHPDLAEARAVITRLASISPGSVCVVSTTDVYGAEGDVVVDETFRPRPVRPEARDAAAAEDALRAWSAASGVPLSILRTTTVFGADMGGWPDRMFSRVVGGRFIHIRGCEARRSIVTAVDVARTARAALSQGGLFNVADGVNPLLTDLADAMGTNAGVAKRPIVLTRKWASVIASFCKAYHIPHAALREALDACKPRPLYSSQLASDELGINFFNTCDVLRRQAPGYPYLTPAR